MTYEIFEGERAIKCLACGLTSYHPEDVRRRYCGKCYLFHERASLYEKLGVDLDFPDQPRIMAVGPPGIEPPYRDPYFRPVRVEEGE